MVWSIRRASIQIALRMIFCAARAMLAAMTQIEQLEPNLWRVQASIKSPPLERVMTIVKLSDGGVLIYSAIMLDEPAMKQLDSLGPVKVIVVPNGWHRMDAPAFKARYPDARLLAPKNARERVAKVVTVDGTLEDFSDSDRRAHDRRRHAWARGDDDGEVRRADVGGVRRCGVQHAAQDRPQGLHPQARAGLERRTEGHAHRSRVLDQGQEGVCCATRATRRAERDPRDRRAQRSHFS